MAARLSGMKVQSLRGSAVSRKEELLEMARSLRAQAEGMSSRDAKQAFQKMADHYEQEAKKLQDRPAPDIFSKSNKARSPKSAA